MNNKRTFLFALVLVVLVMLLGACTPRTTTPEPTSAPAGAVPVDPIAGMPQGSAGFDWWNDSTFYQIFVRSFSDSDGDGIGDFNGITARLDYLNDGDPATTSDLGVTGIWLMPIFASPSYHGYDATDFYAVEPDYGTQEDFERLLEEAHQRGIRIIIDLMLNHTSKEHPWFKEALDPESDKRDWYIFVDGDPAYLGPWGQDPWHSSPSGGFYYGIFWEGMPDLNYTNPEVVAEMQSVVRFWLEEVGVDGFRLDGARYIIEEEDNQASTASTHQFYKDLRTFIKAINPQAVTVGEIWTTSFEVAPYVAGDELDLAFNFDLAKNFLDAAGGRNPAQALDQITLDRKTLEAGGYATFLTNHDQDRVMNVLGSDVKKARNAASLLLTGPGVPFIYYGEEIGMTGAKPDEMIRKPLPWSADPNGGFTSGTPWQPLNPGYEQKNIATQSADPTSLLSHYRTLVQLRSQHQALRVGLPVRVKSASKDVYALLRSSPDETLLVLINLGDAPATDYALSLNKGPLSGSYKLFPIFGSGEVSDLAANELGGFAAYQPLPELPADATLVLQLQRQ